MRIAVLFDGAGLARLGLEQAGHFCTGFEIDKDVHHLAQFVGSGNCVLADATQVDLSGFDAVWASPPCQQRSLAHAGATTYSANSTDYLDWCLQLPHRVLWVENVLSHDNSWGQAWNAAQFGEEPRQSRNRIIGGRYPQPQVYRDYRMSYPGTCPCITATEWKGHAGSKRRASRFYGRKLRVSECAYHQGFEIPYEWAFRPVGFVGSWLNLLYKAVGNGVPVAMARAFGLAAAQEVDNGRSSSA